MGYAEAHAQRAARVLILRETRVRPRLRSAHEVAVGILEERFGIAAGTRAEADRLFDFQREAVARARSILGRHGGVLVADSVGLGKTHVAIELLRPVLARGGRVAVVGPAALEGHWRRAVAGERGVDWLSYGRLSRGHAAAGRHDMVVLDEAHALRNPTTRRYRAALELCRGAHVVLISATPVNNSTWDLYHLLRLFARDDDFRDAGVPSLRSAFERATDLTNAGDPSHVHGVLRAIMIRRGREHIQMRTAKVRVPELRFPQQRPPVSLRYDFAFAGSEVIEQVGRLLLELDFPSHVGMASASSWSSTPLGLLRLGLLKRLESSVHAFLLSVRAYDALLAACLDGLQRGLLVRPRERSVEPDADQLRFDELLVAPAPPGHDSDDYRTRLIAERARVAELIALIAGGSGDSKLDGLLALLSGPLAGRRVVVFTQFRDTALYLHAALLRRCRVGLIHGAGALLGADAADRRTVIVGFAPRANGAPVPREHERVDVLVATDVLSEGFNLQDAEAVVSYDLPWNPIRLVQRVGRVDRLGSQHPFISSYHFLPGQLERYLGLVERMALKVVAIDASVGTDSPALHMDIVRALDDGNAHASPTATVTSRASRRGSGLGSGIEASISRQVDVDETLLAALARAKPTGRSRDCLEVAWLADPTAEDGAPSGLIAARVGARFEWVAVRNGLAVDDEREPARLIELALATTECATDDPAVPPWRPSLDRLLDVVRPVLARRGSAAAALPLLPAGGQQARLGRRILKLAALLPGGPDRATCLRIECALAGLASLPPQRLATLASIGDHPTDLADLLRHVERVVGSAGATLPVVRAPAETAVRLIGALLVARPQR